MYTASLYFAKARDVARDDRRRWANEIRAANALKFCPRPVALLPAGSGTGEVFIHPQNRWLIANSWNGDREALLWDCDRNSKNALPESLSDPTILRWDAEGTRLAVGNQAGHLAVLRFPELVPIWDIELGRSIRHLLFGAGDSCLFVATDEAVYGWNTADHASLGQCQPSAMPRFHLLDDKNEHLIVGGRPWCYVFDTEKIVRPPPVPTESLLDWCRLVSGHDLDTASPLPLSNDQWMALWHKLAPERAGGPAH